ncbi:hypothetical protein [Nocardia crassostreae]|uniref:hypothetical protein n=1 Tax=Nocardia crassostreae TaxID=53428 RepID=UPI0012F9AEE3|nr:hypothetical protein [Nocardia crassostreae]
MNITQGQLPVRFDRKFHLSYVESHAQLLLRSGRGGYHRGQTLRHDSVVDILFKNVATLALMESFIPLEISLADEVEVEKFRRFLKCELGNRNLYALRGEDGLGYVLAGALYWVDDHDGSTEEPSVLIATPERSENMVVMRA